MSMVFRAGTYFTLKFLLLLAFVLLTSTVATNNANDKNASTENDDNNNGNNNDVFVELKEPEIYYTAADSASWAITTNKLSTLLGTEKQQLYDNYITDCNLAAKESIQKDTFCTYNDEARMKMNSQQPQSVYNYTDVGYKKIRLPKELNDIIQSFWKQNKDKAEIEWKSMNVYHNLWESPPTIVHLNQPFHGGSSQLESKINSLVLPILEEWTGQYLSPVSLYGIRLYHNGSILSPHVDRMPLVTSAIIQVDQDIDEPWPLEVYGHDGKATNITMEPGDLVMYESHSVIHGRPFPMKGNFYANAFVHFEPLGPKNGEKSRYDSKLDIPPYLIPDSDWAKEWKQKNPNGWKGKVDVQKIIRQGDFKLLQEIAIYNPDALHEGDQYGWTPLHETIRRGQTNMVKFLLNRVGVDKNVLTNDGKSPLNISRFYLGEKHPLSKYLESIGAQNIPNTDSIESNQMDEL